MILDLDAVVDAVDGIWDGARGRFWVRTAQAAATDRDWSAATQRLLHLTAPLEAVAAGEPAWVCLALAGTECALRADSVDQVRAVVRQTYEHAWPPGDEPNELRSILGLAQTSAVSPRTARALGDMLRSRYPTSGICLYAAAHFAGRGAVGVRRDVDTVARDFEYAAERFDESGDARAADHCRLRAGVLWLTGTRYAERGRSMLRPFRGVELPADEQRWLAYAQAHSPFWLDRVRAADWIGDTLDSATSEASRAAALGVASALFQRLPAELTDPEVDRLEALLAALEGDRRWALEAQLRGRQALADHLDSSLADIDAETARTLQNDALPVRGLEVLVAAWNRRVFTEIESASTPLVDAVAIALRHLDDAIDLRSVAAPLRDAMLDADGQELRPLLLLFTRDVPEETGAEDVLTEAAVHYADRGPAPTFGFLPLAAWLFQQHLTRAGAAMTRRAHQEGESDPSLLELTVAKSVQWAVREGSDREMLEWLETGEDVLQV